MAAAGMPCPSLLRGLTYWLLTECSVHSLEQALFPSFLQSLSWLIGLVGCGCTAVCSFARCCSSLIV